MELVELGFGLSLSPEPVLLTSVLKKKKNRFVELSEYVVVNVRPAPYHFGWKLGFGRHFATYRGIYLRKTKR